MSLSHGKLSVKEQWKRLGVGSPDPESRFLKSFDVSFICLYFLVFLDLFPFLTVFACFI